MTLFDQIHRSDLRPKQQNESSFDYYNISGRRAVEGIRQEVERWYQNCPDAMRLEVRRRFRQRDEVQHQSAFFELYWCELLRKLGYSITPHPVIIGALAQPDFLVASEGSPLFYLEATLAASSLQPSKKRLAALIDRLNRLESPNFFLSLEWEGEAEDNLNGNALSVALRKWLATLNPDEIATGAAAIGAEAFPVYHWQEKGLCLTFYALPKTAPLREKSGVRTIGTQMGDAHRIQTDKEIRSAIDRKAEKYGNLDLPLVVAVNVISDFCDEVDVWNALFGQEQFVFGLGPSGELRQEFATRAANGAWYGRQGARNTTASVVAICDQLFGATLRKSDPLIVHNPWATKPLAANLLPMSFYRVEGGHLKKANGLPAADILGIPQSWPPSD